MEWELLPFEGIKSKRLAITLGESRKPLPLTAKYTHEDVSRMAGGAGRIVAQRQECRDWPFPVESAAEEFRGEQ